MKRIATLSLVVACAVFMTACNINFSKKKESDTSSEKPVTQTSQSAKKTDSVETTKSNEPVELFRMDTFQGDPDFKKGPMDDTYGNHYDHMYIIKTNSGDSSFSYLLNGEYKELKGTIIWSKEYKNDSTGWYTLSFYDGDTCLYTTAKCEVTNSPIEFTVDVSGVKTLTIEFDGFSNEGPFEWGSLITVQKNG